MLRIWDCKAASTSIRSPRRMWAPLLAPNASDRSLIFPPNWHDKVMTPQRGGPVPAPPSRQADPCSDAPPLRGRRGGLGQQPVNVSKRGFSAQRGEDYSCRAQWGAGLGQLAEREQAAAMSQQRLGLF